VATPRVCFRLLRHAGTAANLTRDAQIAALAIEHQGEVHSNDGDFARFPHLLALAVAHEGRLVTFERDIPLTAVADAGPSNLVVL
jgi:hypothetical protein